MKPATDDASPAHSHQRRSIAHNARAEAAINRPSEYAIDNTALVGKNTNSHAAVLATPTSKRSRASSQTATVANAPVSSDATSAATALPPGSTQSNARMRLG